MGLFKNRFFLIPTIGSVAIFQIVYLFVDQSFVPFFQRIPLPFAPVLSWLISSFLHLFIWGALFIIAHMNKMNQRFILSQIFLSQLFAAIISACFKMLLGRARPTLFLQNGIYGFYGLTWENSYHSFPSAHTLTAFTLASSLSLIYPRWKFLFFAFATLTSLSRLSLLQHYLSDLFGSALIGIIIGSFDYQNLNKIYIREK